MSRLALALLLLPLLPGVGPRSSPERPSGPEPVRRVAAGVVEGVVILERRPARRVPQRYPGATTGPSSTVQQIEPVVFLRGAAGEETAGSRGRSRVMAQRDTTFRPPLLFVRPGDTVEFPNRDPFFHNVFSYSDAARFDLGRYPRGQSKSVTFEKPGLVRIYCEVHDFMRAAVVVTRNPYHTRPDADGRFRLDGVPPGRYTVVGWHADRGRVTEEITVPEGGRVEVRLDFS